MKKTIFTLFALALPMLASAADYTDANGIIYELGGKGTNKIAKVKGATAALKATKVLDIPETVNDGTDTYTVTTIIGGDLGGETKIYVADTDVDWTSGSPKYGDIYLNSEWDSNLGTTRYYYSEYQNWTKVTIPATITTIDGGAFMMAGVTTLDVADLSSWCKITCNGNAMWNPQHFYVNGSEVTSITIPSDVTSISKYLFQGFKSINSVAIPGTVLVIGEFAFDGSGITTLTLSEGIKNIGECAFAHCNNLTSVMIPSTYEGIYYGAFSNCQNLTTAIIKSDVASSMFSGCSNLVNVTLEDGCTSISGNGFAGTGITSITIPATLKMINMESFYGCPNLKTVTMKYKDDGVMGMTSIYSNAFGNCPKLEDFYCEVPFANMYVDGNPFENSKLEEGATLHVPSADVTSYQTTTPWSQFPYVVALAGSTTPPTPTIPDNITATIGTLGMATLYSEYALDFSGVTGLKAYIVSAFTPATNRAILTQVYDVPAKTGVVLVGAADTYTIPTTTTETYVANLLKGVSESTMMWSSDGMNTNYILANGTNGLGFYVVQDGGTNLAAGKAYLAIPKSASSAAPSFVMMNLEGADVTGIESIENSVADMAGKAVYNLNGQRQNGLKKGINIVGGKKMIVK